MAGLSVLVEPFYPITMLSLPIQLLLLIAFFSFSTLSLSFYPSHPLCLFRRGHQLSTMSLWGLACPWPSSSAVCVCVCLFACVCVWISNAGWHCVCRGKGQRLFFSNLFRAGHECLKKAAESWLVRSDYRKWRSGASLHLHQQWFKAPQSRG